MAYLTSHICKPIKAITTGHNFKPPVLMYHKSAAINHRPTNRIRIPNQPGHFPVGHVIPIIFFLAIQSPQILFELNFILNP